VIIHVVFSTKNREPFLNSEIRSRIHAYLATIIRDMGSHAYRIGGNENHVHIACTLPRTISQSNFLKKIKTSSSKWIKGQGVRKFSWQNGYGAFSIGQPQLPQLLHYIDHQLEHHKKKTFKEEYRGLLKRYKINYDESYVWN
jgi:REP element-mobilizing transposase RayT